MAARYIIVILLLISIPLLCPFHLRAQQQADTLKEAIIKAKKRDTGDAKSTVFSPGMKMQAIDSATLRQYNMQSVATLLAQQLPVFIKIYGFNGLATLGFRGASAAQSAVLWNGVPIQNAALGVADISALPVMFMNKVTVAYGGSAALYGSGNVGGALLLENESLRFDSGKRSLAISAAAGSYSQYSGGLEGTASGKKWFVSAKMIAQTAKNNFLYKDENGSSLTMGNSTLGSLAGMLHAGYKTGRYSTIECAAWLQQYNREIPPALFEMQGSRKKQQDGSLRLLLGWNKQKKLTSWYAKAAFIRDNTRYDDAAILLYTNNSVYQYYQEAGWRRQQGKYGQLQVFIPVQLSWLAPTGSGTTNTIQKTAIAAAYAIKLLHNKLDIAANIRGEKVNKLAYVLPGANALYQLTNWCSLRANVQRTMRMPTLNELYYFPGGNTLLKPEQGWSEDGGYAVKFRVNNFTILHDASVFSRNIHDWIIWLGGAVWTPHNIAAVYSRGVETENKIQWGAGNFKLHLKVNTAYILATTVSSYVYNDGSINRQIPYCPRYNGQLNIGVTYRQLYINYNHTYTGYRFTVADESRYLPPYQTGNLQIMYTHTTHKNTIQFTAQCNNLWNKAYQVVEGRPMPGINWLAGVRLGIGE